MKLIYNNLDLQIEIGKGSDTTSDIIFFQDPASKEYIQIENSLKHQPKGIRTLATVLGIKKTTKSDFTFITLNKPCNAAAVLTRCACPSYTILRNREILKDGKIQAIAVNSGNANVFTPTGNEDLKEIARLLATEFNIAENDILISSTGVIGVSLPMDKFRNGIPGIKTKLEENNLGAASQAILTTDAGPKTASINHNGIQISGIAKGAGMIEPNLATMLVYLFTNIKITSKQLQEALEFAVDDSFNAISIDSDTSTSDTVCLLSTEERECTDSQFTTFKIALRALCVKLARDIVSQGEGVTKIIEASVETEVSLEFSKKLAKKIINSPLVKAAVHGADPNWGRVVAALGKPDDFSKTISVFPEEQIEIMLCDELVFSKKQSTNFDLKAISKKIKDNKFTQIAVKIGNGGYLSRVWGSDLTEEYVTFNSDYTS